MWEAPWHWVVLALLVIALFGYKKLPDAARSLGHSLRIFKTEIKGMADDDRARENAQTRPAVEAAPAAQPGTAQPLTAQPATDQPATDQSATAQSATAQPGTDQPAAQTVPSRPEQPGRAD